MTYYYWVKAVAGAQKSGESNRDSGRRYSPAQPTSIQTSFGTVVTSTPIVFVQGEKYPIALTIRATKAVAVRAVVYAKGQPTAVPASLTQCSLTSNQQLSVPAVLAVPTSSSGLAPGPRLVNLQVSVESRTSSMPANRWGRSAGSVPSIVNASAYPGVLP
jgi:hypothetical protein